MTLKELRQDVTMHDLIMNILFEKQSGLCPVCGDDLDWDITLAPKSVKSDIKTLYDLRLVCNGNCKKA